MAGRLFRIIMALAVAIACAAIVFVVTALSEPAVRDMFGAVSLAALIAMLKDAAGGGDPAAMLDGLFGLYMVVVTLLTVPPALVALIGETLGWRSYVWYAGATGAAMAAFPWIGRGLGRAGTEGEYRVTLVLFLTGIAGGFVYWALAGRVAGRVTAPGSPEP